MPLSRISELTIAVQRCPGSIVFRATTPTWREFHGRVVEFCSSGCLEVSIPVVDIGVSYESPYGVVTILTLRCASDGLRQSYAQTQVLVEGAPDDLLTLAENIDMAAPVEQSHYHSDEWTPGVLPNSTPLVFAHVSQPYVL